jgi:hypothetical protein
MWAAQSSEQCLKEKRCLPIGGHSVWGSKSVNISKEDGKGIYIVSAKMDSTSFFHDLAYGNAQRSGFITVLGIADALSKINNTEMPNHIVYTIFNNENYGYGGSQRFVHDIKSECKDENGCEDLFRNLDFEKIKGVIDFDSIGLMNTNAGPERYYLHVDSLETSSSLVGKLSGSFSNYSLVSSTDVTKGLPPSSLQSFLLQKRSIPGVIVSDYDDIFSNVLYNADADLAEAWTESNLDSICALTTSLARSIYSLAGETESIPSEISANCTFVSFKY